MQIRGKTQRGQQEKEKEKATFCIWLRVACLVWSGDSAGVANQPRQKSF